jgi:guanine deaminase
MKTLRARTLSPLSATESRYIKDATLVLDGEGRIATLQEYDGRGVDEDIRDHLLVPGFVDTHIHFPQTRVIGRASGPLLPWLENVVFPEEGRFASVSHSEKVAELFCEQLARHGTTLPFIYSSVHESAADTLFRALKRRGQRGFAGPVLMDQGCPEDLKLGVEDAIPALERLKASWHGEMLKLAVIPRFALSCSQELLKAAGRFANEHNLYVSTHISENLDECRLTRELFGSQDYLEVYEAADLIHERCVLAHCIHLSESECNRILEAGATVAHCPDSNAFLGSGSMPTGRMLDLGMKLAVGTDVAAGRTFSVPEVLARAYDNGRVQGVEIPLETLFYWGTRGGALALDVPQVGHLEVGADADMAQISIPDWIHDKEDALSALLFDRANTRVERTWVKGRVVFASP